MLNNMTIREKNGALWSAHTVVLKIIGFVLLVAAFLKGYELLTRPVAESSIWTSRWFLIAQVEWELLLGIWLLSGLYRRVAWLVGLVCFSMFSLVTLYKGLSGAESCGCFGSVPVNPWITLFAIDLPAVIALAIFQPNLRLTQPVRYFPHRLAVSSILILAIGIPGGIAMANFEPTVMNSEGEIIGDSPYIILEPETWVGKELPILNHIDIGDQLKDGNWLLLLYHHDCPDCRKAMPEYEKLGRDLAGNEEFLRIAFVEMPPYGHGPTSDNSPCMLGKMDDSKEWFVTTPSVAIIARGKVKKSWEAEAPGIQNILEVTATYVAAAND